MPAPVPSAWLRSVVFAAFPGLCFGLLAVAEPPVPKPSAGSSASYVGVLTNAPRSARIALVVESGKFQAYVCSQDAEFNQTHSRWFEGDIDAQGAFRAANGGLGLRGTLQAKQVKGELVGPDLKKLGFVAEAVAAAGDAGLYRSEATVDAEEYVAGWIIDLDDNVAGAVGLRNAERVVTPQAGRAGANLSPRAPTLPAKAVSRLGATGNIAKLNGLSPNKQGAKQVGPKALPKRNPGALPPAKKLAAKDQPAEPANQNPPAAKDVPPMGKQSPAKDAPPVNLPLPKKGPLPKLPPANDQPSPNDQPPVVNRNAPVQPMPVKKGPLPKDVAPPNDQPPPNPPPDVGAAPMPPKPVKVMPPKLAPKNNPPGPNPPADQVQPPGDPAAVVEGNPPAEGAGEEIKQTKIDDAVREENRQARSARIQAKGGSPFLAVFMQQACRSLAGAEPANGLETRIGEVLAAAPKESLQQFVNRFDQLPEADRKALLGPSADLLPVETGLLDETLEKVREAVAAQSPKKPLRAALPADGGVKKVQLGKLHCVRETPPSGVGSDDVLLIHVVASGRTHAVKVSEPIRNLDTGASQPIPPADGVIWPPGDEEKAANEELSVVVGILEDDSGNPQETAAVLRAFAATTQAIAENISAGLLDFDLTEAITNGFDAFAAGLPSADFLGVDRGTVQTDGKVTSATGTAKTKFCVQQKGGNGKLKSQYDLAEIKVEK